MEILYKYLLLPIKVLKQQIIQLYTLFDIVLKKSKVCGKIFEIIILIKQPYFAIFWLNNKQVLAKLIKYTDH